MPDEMTTAQYIERGKLMQSTARAALAAAGADPDLAVLIAHKVQINDPGVVDPASVTAAVEALKAQKPYCFPAAKVAESKEEQPRDARKMTEKEYEAALWQMKQNADKRLRDSMRPKWPGKSALEMTDQELNEWRRKNRMHTPLMSDPAPRPLNKPAEQDRTWAAKNAEERWAKAGLSYVITTKR